MQKAKRLLHLLWDGVYSQSPGRQTSEKEKQGHIAAHSFKTACMDHGAFPVKTQSAMTARGHNICFSKQAPVFSRALLQLNLSYRQSSGNCFSFLFFFFFFALSKYKYSSSFTFAFFIYFLTFVIKGNF